jgi:uncharacterized protein CbrC (UPF0167 family)
LRSIRWIFSGPIRPRNYVKHEDQTIAATAATTPTRSSVRPGPITVPSLARRAHELPRIVDEFAEDAVAELRALDPGFTDTDRAWALERAATSPAEIEKATLRRVAHLSDAAKRLGMASVALGWRGRRWKKTRSRRPIGA